MARRAAAWSSHLRAHAAQTWTTLPAVPAAEIENYLPSSWPITPPTTAPPTVPSALPSLMNLVNTVLKLQPDSPFPNGLPLAIGVARHTIGLTFGTAPGTSVYKVAYGWS